MSHSSCNNALSSSFAGIDSAIVFAAGLGKRMLPLTKHTPKSLLTIKGKPLLAYNLEMLIHFGIKRIIVNCHYQAEQIKHYLMTCPYNLPELHISYEPTLLDTGGGIVKALPYLGNEAFFAINSDIIVVDDKLPAALDRLAHFWQPKTMDMVLLLQPTNNTIGYEGHGDFALADTNQLIRTASSDKPFVFTGIQILKVGLFKGLSEKKFSLSDVYRKIQQPDGYLKNAYGLVHHGAWLHIGTPAGLEQAHHYFCKTL